MKKIIVLALITILGNINPVLAQNATLNNAMNQAKNAGGDFNSSVSNPFIFCAAPKPSKHSPMRVVWDQVCSSGNAKATPAPVPVPVTAPASTTRATQTLQQQFNKDNNTNNLNILNNNINTSNISSGSSNRNEIMNNLN